MTLVASMNTRNELSRYLKATVPHLLTYCDEVRVQDDGSTDGTYEWLREQEGVTVRQNGGTRWEENEGLLHQQLLDFTLEARPTFVLAIDADEIVPDGPRMRAYLDEGQRTYTLRMVEVWRRDPWVIRLDGGWRPHPVGVLYRAPARSRREWQIWGRKLAGGRVPRIVRSDQRAGRARDLDVDILHLGWSDPTERLTRWERYVQLDGGRYHDSAHLNSIMWPDERCTLAEYKGPVPPCV